MLTDRNIKPLLIVYLRSRESIEITGINDGDYELYLPLETNGPIEADPINQNTPHYKSHLLCRPVQNIHVLICHLLVADHLMMVRNYLSHGG